MTSASAVAAGATRRSPAHVRWALMFGNFVIGCGVMVVPGTLADLARSLGVSVALAGQLIAIGAATVCFGAPLIAGWVAAYDRRRLLAFTLVAYGAGHVLSAATPSYAALWLIRAVTMLGAAVFTPQAAATIGFMSTPESRGRDITFIFVGWSMASVFGLPLSAWIGNAYGWRAAFVAVAGLSVLSALWVFTVMPDGVRPAGLTLAAWKRAFSSPLLMAIVAVTFLSGAGQFTIFSYFTPYYREVLHASPTQVGLLLMWFGAFGVIGNIALGRIIDRTGAASAATAMVVLMTVSFLAWPLATSLTGMAVALVPWGLGCFSANSAQQARLSAVAPALAPALLALNTSAIYLGQAAGASSGGWLIAHRGFGALSFSGLVWLVAAIAASVWATRRAMRLAQ